MGWAWEGDGVDQLQTIHGKPGQVSPGGSHANSLRSPWVKTQGCLRFHGKPGFRLRTPRSAVPRSRPHNGSIFSCQRSSTASRWPLGAQPPEQQILRLALRISAGDIRRHTASTRMRGGRGRVNRVMSQYYQVDRQWQSE